jgi:hypothetical protein
MNSIKRKRPNKWATLFTLLGAQYFMPFSSSVVICEFLANEDCKMKELKRSNDKSCTETIFIRTRLEMATSITSKETLIIFSIFFVAFYYMVDISSL